MARIDVLKTYKIFIGGKFPRTESGRFFINGLGLMYKMRVLEISYND